MDQSKYQLAHEYCKRIEELREELSRVDRCNVIEIRSGDRRDMMPEVFRTRKEDPKLFAVVKAHIEAELQEYRDRFQEL